MSPLQAEFSPVGHRIGSQRFITESMLCCLCLDGVYHIARYAGGHLELRQTSGRLQAWK